MKEPKLAPALAITISFHLMVSPVLSYAGPQDTVGAVLGAMNQVAGNGRPTPPTAAASQFTAAGEQILKQQLTPIPQDKLFNPRLAQIPGLASFFASHGASLNCTTLRSTLSEVQSDSCKEIDPRKNIDTQVKETKLFEQYYKDINKMYGESFKTDSNSGGQLYGLGCMNKAKETLEQFFIHRETELTKLTNEIDKLNQNFKESSKQDLENIEDAVAVLDGGDGEISRKVRERNKELLNFAKNFDNPACTSMFSKNQYDSKGLAKGLNGISEELKEKFTSTDNASGYSAETYTNLHSKIVEDINSLAEKVATQVKLNPADLQKGPAILNDLQGLGSTYNTTSALTPDLFSDIQLDFKNQNSKLQKAFDVLRSDSGVPALSGGVDFRSDDDSKLDNEIAKLEKEDNNSCLARDVKFDQLKAQIFKPNVKKKTSASKAPSSYISELESVVSGDYTLDQKLERLKALDNDKMFSNRFFIKKPTSYKVESLSSTQNIQTERISANSMESPSLAISRIIKNCQNQFKINKLPNKLTKEETFKKLKALNKDWKKLANNQASEMKNQVIKKLLSCPDQTPGIGSCDSKSFGVGKGFCARTALTCSNNMRQCTEQADNFVKKFNQVKSVHTTNYKNHIKKHRSDMTNVFKSALARFEGDSGMLAKAFGAEFKTPGDIGYEVTGDASLKPFDPAMGLEDPEKYAAMFRANIVKLIESVKTQGTDILAKVDKHLESTANNYKIVADKANTYALACEKSFKDFDTAQKKQAEAAEKFRTELGEKTGKFCRKYGQAQQNHKPGCSGNISDIVSGVSGVPGLQAAGNELEEYCSEMKEEKENNQDLAAKICLTQEIKDKEKITGTCKEFFKCSRKNKIPPELLEAARKEENKNKDVDKDNHKTEAKDAVVDWKEENSFECDDSIKKAAADSVVEESSDKTSKKRLSGLPAACSATDNSNPSTPKSGLEGIMDGIRRGISSGAKKQ